ncbi:tetratricopeptide repeat protein [Microvirga massiliensis]|uniref:tetratricopeptide repeat protein n=1 Tax=Microvirga massiliensis TaxID=1033741 RepID=UPI00062BEB73|nr:tetratricopeptide repeat protein [Microvirga massiliensis]
MLPFDNLSSYRGALTSADRANVKRKRPTDLNAYELFLLATEKKHQLIREGVDESTPLLLQATEKDPGFSRAWTCLAWAYTLEAMWADDERPWREKAIAAAQRAVETDPSDGDAHPVLGHAVGELGDLVGAEAELNRALALNPSSADILTWYSSFAACFGKSEEEVATAERAIKLNPNFPNYANRDYAYAFFMGGRYESALQHRMRMPRKDWNRNDFVIIAGSYAQLGQVEEAHQVVSEALTKFPNLSIEGFALLKPGLGAGERERFTMTIRAAGFPACAPLSAFPTDSSINRLPECMQG